MNQRDDSSHRIGEFEPEPDIDQHEYEGDRCEDDCLRGEVRRELGTDVVGLSHDYVRRAEGCAQETLDLVLELYLLISSGILNADEELLGVILAEDLDLGSVKLG
jgi:hypothetical protein